MATNENGLLIDPEMAKNFGLKNKQDFDAVQNAVMGTIGSVTAGAIANTQNVDATQNISNYQAMNSVGYIGNNQYNNPTSLDNINTLLNGAMQNGVKAAVDINKLKIDQMDSVMKYTLDYAKMYEDNAQFNQTMELEKERVELSRQELGLSRDQFTYSKGRDSVEDNQWSKSFNEQQRQFNESMAMNKDQFNKSFNEDQRQFDMNYNQNQDQFDKEFGENARQFDLNYNEDSRQFEKNYGLQEEQFEWQQTTDQHAMDMEAKRLVLKEQEINQAAAEAAAQRAAAEEAAAGSANMLEFMNSAIGDSEELTDAQAAALAPTSDPLSDEYMGPRNPLDQALYNINEAVEKSPSKREMKLAEQQAKEEKKKKTGADRWNGR